MNLPVKKNEVINTPAATLYAAFDAYPAAKGAAVHIREFASALFEYLPYGLLLVAGGNELPAWQIEDNCQIRRLVSGEKNYLKRALKFSDFVYQHAQMLKNHLKIAHFRDPWSGMPIVDCLKGSVPLIYEVNGLPSIELPARYSNISSDTLIKIQSIEDKCAHLANQIVCPSVVIKDHLISRGIERSKISVIRNGAEIIDEQLSLTDVQVPEKFIIYSGAAQSWQGIETLFKAMTYLKDKPDLKLVLCITAKKKRKKYLKMLAKKLRLSDSILWLYSINQRQVAAWMAKAHISVAPLTECERNLVQGCCPIKIIESMASKTIVVASDLPVVRELVEHNKTGWLVRPDRPAELARAIRILLENPQERERIESNAFNKFKNQLTWQQAKTELIEIYKKLCKL